MLAIHWQESCQSRVDDINTGDEVNHEYGSGLIAERIKMDKGPDLCADAPPLEAMKAFLSSAVTEGIGSSQCHM